MDTEIKNETSSLNTDIYLSGTGMFKNLNVGNTGLYYETGVINEGWYQHFKPEGSEEPVQGNESKFTNLFASGLYHLAIWWKENNFEKIGLKKPLKIVGYTNTRMSDLRMNLLGEGVYKEINRYGDKLTYHLDIEALIGNEETMDRLRKISERCERQNYQINRAPKSK